MIPQWKMNGKDMRFNGETEIGIVEVRDLFDDLVVTLWVDQEAVSYTHLTLPTILRV